MAGGKGHVIDDTLESDVLPSDLTPRQVSREFKQLLDRGARIKPAGSARRDPMSLLSSGYTPRYKLQVFDTTFYLTNLREDDNFRFFVAYILMPAHRDSRGMSIYPRIIYKDSSLIWRSPSHYIRSEQENWIGKGDLKVGLVDGVELEYSAEETTNLPFEMQAALDTLSRSGGRVRPDHAALGRILRRAPDGRFEPYRDFSEPRRKAMSESGAINRGEYVAHFSRQNDPGSLRFVSGFEPDFQRGIVEISHSKSNIYGGEIGKHRILSMNREIQYLFIAAPRQVWIIFPQTLTTDLTSYGVRTIDVNAEEDLFVPGFEYHYMDETEDPPQLFSQIPEGFVGETSEVDPSRASASPWIEALPVVQSFRRAIAAPRSRPRIAPNRSKRSSSKRG